MSAAWSFKPASDRAELQERCRVASLAAAELVEAIARDLPQSAHAELSRLLETGGRVGLEVTVDRAGANAYSLVAYDGAGTRQELVQVAMQAPAGVAH